MVIFQHPQKLRGSALALIVSPTMEVYFDLFPFIKFIDLVSKGNNSFLCVTDSKH